MLRKLQHTKRFLLQSRHFIFVTSRTERGEVGLRIRSKLEYLLFHSMWETYFCVHFQSYYGRNKTLQSFWYTLYMSQILYLFPEHLELLGVQYKVSS
jgi:hypothetical protein